ncbi:hypothetical protein MKZ02_19815 [Pseudobacillus sp. FSL P4-0506]|uniref:hypothetical protein n=1 Tax=Pseudobacillus sp. FSL P4-0506 TaxID=2921576 RepID=UPI0030FA2AB6
MLGAGTLANPYIIQTPTDLNSIRNNLTAYYELGNDIDLSVYPNFVPIGTSSSSQRFKGTFDGKGFKIKNLKINSSTANIGLFAFVENAIIKNVALIDAQVVGNAVNYVGALSGYAFGTTLIQNCYSTGTASGQYGVGGLIGWHSSGTIENCWSNVDVSGMGRAGGLVGNLVSATSYIKNSYAYGNVSSTNTSYPPGGLIGDLGTTVSNVTNSYFNKDICPTSPAGTGLTTVQMKQQSSYVGWDFTNTWGINGDYPYLQIFGVPEKPAKIQTVNLSSNLSNLIGSVNLKKKKVITPESTINPIFSIVSLGKSTKRSVEGYSLPIHSQVDISHRTINSRVIDLISTMKPISSDIYRSVVKVTNLTSHMKPLSVDLSVLIPIRNEVINAYVEVVKNGSQAVEIFNNSDLSIIENPSSVEVIE